MVKAAEKPRGVGPRLRQLRIEAGLTQAQLAERAGVADATLSRIERNRLNPSVRLARELARALGAKVDALFDAGERPAKKPALRNSEARLLALVRDLDDAQVDDVAKAVKLLLHVGRRGASAPR